MDEAFVGDSLRLNQILTNLLSNALKFTPEGGSIQLRVTRMTQSGEQPDENVWLRFEVIDTGCGIAKERQEAIFESFEQESADVTQKYGGTGLGLAIVKKFTELMGGSVRITSTLGSGSTFTVELPFGKAKERGEPVRYEAVSYTHLDVYKRQPEGRRSAAGGRVDLRASKAAAGACGRAALFVQHRPRCV